MLRPVERDETPAGRATRFAAVIEVVRGKLGPHFADGMTIDEDMTTIRQPLERFELEPGFGPYS